MPRPFILRDFPHCFHQSFRLKICVAAEGPHVIDLQLGAPAAVGESTQVGSDKTADGQEQNRRVVVRGLLQSLLAQENKDLR
jgi:hypothetical protein